MNIESVLKEYDGLFGTTSLSCIEEYLYEKIIQALQEQDDAAILTLLNEMIGLCRDTSQKDKALAYCEQVQKLLDKMGLQGTKEYATSMQNVANAYRAFGRWEEAQEAFCLIEATYEICLPKGDYLWASMFNNWGLLYQEKGEYEQAVSKIENALAVIEKLPESHMEQAITKTNLANSLFGLGTQQALEKGYQYLCSAIAVFVQDGERDFHYGAALVAMGDYYVYIQNNMLAKAYYQKGIVEILMHTGKTEFYQRVVEKYDDIVCKLKKQTVWKKNISKSREFYEAYGRQMIHEVCPGYESRIAVGMVGEGSDCFGYDDAISSDHDYDIGFCMWLTQEDMDKIGDKLQKAYQELVEKHAKGENVNARLGERRGVFCVDTFFVKQAQEYRLAQMVNGEIFRDELGVVTKKRKELLEYYPQPVWRRKLAGALHEFAQYGQANYARMMARGDYLTAQLCVGKAMETAMDIGYILLQKYAPYYKWKRKGLEETGQLRDALWICEELAQVAVTKQAWEGVTYNAKQLNTKDRRVVLLETLAGVLLEEMKTRGLVKGEDTFLEVYVEQILEGINVD